jgi:uncharacterized protein (TIGR01615 family)
MTFVPGERAFIWQHSSSSIYISKPRTAAAAAAASMSSGAVLAARRAAPVPVPAPGCDGGGGGGGASEFLFHLEEDTLYSPPESQSQSLRQQQQQQQEQPIRCARAVKERVRWFARPGGAFERRLLHDMRGINRREGGGDACDCVVLASRLASMGYDVRVRRAVVGCSDRFFRNLRHEFLLVRGEDDTDGSGLVVELRLRDHFAVPHATERYADLLGAVPLEFVGPPSRLRTIVDALCDEMARSFEERGLALPPWRGAPAIASKWMPVRVQDFPQASPHASPQLVAPPLDARRAAARRAEAFLIDQMWREEGERGAA